MNVQPYPVVDLVIETFGDWLKHRRELKEMREMDAASFDQIASDLRISSADLEQLVRQGPHAADELPKMLRALGIDQAELARTETLVLRDMERVCSLCNQKRRCGQSSPPAPPSRTTKSIAAMLPPSTVWVRTRNADNLRHNAMKMARPIWLKISIAAVLRSRRFCSCACAMPEARCRLPRECLGRTSPG